MTKLKFSYFFFLSIILLVLNGCIQVETDLNVNKDGSGTIEETVLLSNEVVNMLKDFIGAFSDSSKSDGFKIFNEEELKSKAEDYGQGVEYVSGIEINEGDYQGFKVVYAFNDLNTIKLSPDPDNKISIGDEQVNDKEEQEYYQFKFEKGESPEIIISSINNNLNVEESDNGSDTESQEVEDSTFIGMMKGMKININLFIDGQITETNAAFKEDNKITLLGIDFSKIFNDPEAFAKLKQENPGSLKEFQEAVKNIPGIKVETGYPLTIKFN